MATDLDGFAALGAIARAPHLFASARLDASGAARAITVKQLKEKSLSLDDVRAIRGALGAEPFALIVDGMKDAEVKGLVTRLDRNHPELKAMGAADQRRLFLALADDLAPATKAGKPVKAPRAVEAKTISGSTPERALASKAMAARSPRTKASSKR